MVFSQSRKVNCWIVAADGAGRRPKRKGEAWIIRGFENAAAKALRRDMQGSKWCAMVLQNDVSVEVEVKVEKLFEEYVKFWFVRAVVFGCKRKRKEQTRTVGI